MLLCLLMGGTPFSPGWGYPIQSWQGVYPIPGPGGGTPFQVWTGRYPLFWPGMGNLPPPPGPGMMYPPPGPGMMYPLHPDLGWGTPPWSPAWHTPTPSAEWVPPPPGPGMGYPPGHLDGVPPAAGRGIPTAWTWNGYPLLARQGTPPPPMVNRQTFPSINITFPHTTYAGSNNKYHLSVYKYVMFPIGESL